MSDFEPIRITRFMEESITKPTCHCMKRDDRYQSMADVRADLDRLTASALAPEPQ
jgi:hypothetical protein